MTTIEDAIKNWEIENFTTKICLFCEYVVQENGEEDFRKHLSEEHKDEIKEFFELVETE